MNSILFALAVSQLAHFVLADPCVGNVGVVYKPGATCADYIVCVDTVAQPQLTCPDGLMFDVGRQMCYYADQVTCSKATGGASCAGNVGVKFLAGAECSNYFACVEEEAQAELTCPDGLMFDEGRQMCYYADQVTCGGSAAENPCVGNIGTKFVKGADCKSYFTCANEVAQPHTCTGDFLFDEANQMCNHPDLVTC